MYNTHMTVRLQLYLPSLTVAHIIIHIVTSSLVHPRLHAVWGRGGGGRENSDIPLSIVDALATATKRVLIKGVSSYQRLFLRASYVPGNVDRRAPRGIKFDGA